MMSPGPTPQPVYNPNYLPPSSSMVESPRPARSTAFPIHHPLPPPIPLGNSPRTGAPRFPGPALAPLAISNSHSGGPSLPGQPHPSAYLAQNQNHGPPHLSPIHHHPPPHHSPHHSPSHQLPLPHSPLHQSSPHYSNDTRRSQSYGVNPAHQPIYSSEPPPSRFTPGLPLNNSFGREYHDVRRFGNETDSRSRPSMSNMVRPPPTFRQEDIHRNSPQPTRYSGLPLSVPVVDESSSIHLEDPPNQNLGRYQIEVRQQPVAARACGFGERDRRVVDPPPIVQLIANIPGTDQTDPVEIRYPFNVVHCTLWSVDGKTDETALVGVDNRLTRRLMGTLVSSPFVGLDEDGNEGCFFCFPDLSCRTNGRYRLRFVLMRLEPSALRPDGYTPIITETMSDVFQVYTAKEFPGMRPSTALTKALKRQGCAIAVKKGNEKTAGNAGGSGKDEGSGEEDTPSSGGAGEAKRRRKG